MNIGLVLVGGLLVGTLLSLFVVPVVYTLLTRWRVRVAEAPPVAEPAPLPQAAE